MYGIIGIIVTINKKVNLNTFKRNKFMPNRLAQLGQINYEKNLSMDREITRARKV